MLINQGWGGGKERHAILHGPVFFFFYFQEAGKSQNRWAGQWKLINVMIALCMHVFSGGGNQTS